LRMEPLGDGRVRVVYEALAGRTPRPARLSGGEHALLFRAPGPLPAVGVTHGSVGGALVIEDHGPALLVAGRGPSRVTVDGEQRLLSVLVVRADLCRRK